MPVTTLPVPSGIKSVQRGTVTLAAAMSATAAIAAVNMAKAEIRFLGGSNNGSMIGVRVELTNANTVTAVSQANVSGSVGFEVTEWY